MSFGVTSQNINIQWFLFNTVYNYIQSDTIYNGMNDCNEYVYPLNASLETLSNTHSFIIGITNAYAFNRDICSNDNTYDNEYLNINISLKCDNIMTPSPTILTTTEDGPNISPKTRKVVGITFVIVGISIVGIGLIIIAVKLYLESKHMKDNDDTQFYLELKQTNENA